ncbi:MAG TPA: AraC family transcriptional regulator [Candidatus Limnocylindrales bacterium]
MVAPAPVAPPVDLAPVEQVRAWKPAVPGIREVLHATFRQHAYPRHTHDDWTVFIVDDGAIRYDLDRRDNEAPRALVSILPPGVVHDGRPGSPRGYRKRVLYVDTTVLPESLIGPAVDRPAIPSPTLWAEVSALHDALARADDVLEAETRFALVAEAIRESFGLTGGERPRAPEPTAGDALRAYLDARPFERATLAEAAAATGWSEAHLARSFTARFGITPHAYVTGRRLDAARDRILDGQPLADVAAEVGFVDQAHLTRRFRSFLATTPARFAAAG